MKKLKDVRLFFEGLIEYQGLSKVCEISDFYNNGFKQFDLQLFGRKYHIYKGQVNNFILENAETG